MWYLRPLLPHFLYVWLFCLFQNLLTSLCPCGVTTMTLWAGFCQTSTPKPCRTEALLSVLCVLLQERQLLVKKIQVRMKRKMLFFTWALSRNTSKSAWDKNWLYNTPERKKHCVKLKDTKCFTETSVYFQMAFTTP